MKNLLLGLCVIVIMGAASFSPYIMRDSVTGAVVTESLPHYKTHAGARFVYADTLTLDTGDTVVYAMSIPDSSESAIHWHPSFSSSGAISAGLYELAEITGGDTLSYYCTNRNFTDIDHADLIKNPTTSSRGNLLYPLVSGGVGVGAGAVEFGLTPGRDEYVIKPGVTLVYIVSRANANAINFEVDWYIQRMSRE